MSATYFRLSTGSPALPPMIRKKRSQDTLTDVQDSCKPSHSRSADADTVTAILEQVFCRCQELFAIIFRKSFSTSTKRASARGLEHDEYLCATITHREYPVMRGRIFTRVFFNDLHRATLTDSCFLRHSIG